MTLAGPWPTRLTWLALPVALGPALEDALADRTRAVGLVVAVLAWAVWTVGVVAVLVPRTLGLTFLRVASPAALAVAVWAAASGADTWAVALAVGVASAATVASLSPTTGDAFVNGSAYGPERRFALRVPGPLLLGPIQLVWVVVVVGAVAGPLLLATEQWLLGGIATAVGLPLAGVASRSLHQLSRRWLVFVPAGLVIHDPTAVAAQLVERSAIRSIGPAPADTTAHDLTGGAFGLALEVRLTEATTFELIGRRGAARTPVETDRVLVSPTTPGAVLAEAAERRIAVA